MVSAPITCTATKTHRNASSARRRGHRRASSVIDGAPITMPMAKAEVSRPAAGMDTCRSAAMPGTSPDSMNSEVPWANTASPRT